MQKYIFVCFLHCFIFFVNSFVQQQQTSNFKITSITLNSVLGNKYNDANRGQLNKLKREIAEEEILDPNETTWFEMFPNIEIERTNVLDEDDYTHLKPDDPLFLGMNWPSKPGPLATAFAGHMKWRRQLSDFESKTKYY